MKTLLDTVKTTSACPTSPSSWVDVLRAACAAWRACRTRPAVLRCLHGPPPQHQYHHHHVLPAHHPSLILAVSRLQSRLPCPRKPHSSASQGGPFRRALLHSLNMVRIVSYVQVSAPFRAHESSHRLLCPATPLSVLVSRFPFLCFCVLAHYRGHGTKPPYSHLPGPCFAWVLHGKHDSHLPPFGATACSKPSLPVRLLSAQASCSVRNRRVFGSLARSDAWCPARPVICNRQH